jgi:drug/metabolite transporter (DMT)-like permease
MHNSLAPSGVHTHAANLDRTSRKKLVAGIAVGLLAAGIGALYTVFARLGIAHGLASSDMTFLRFGVAGVVTMPMLIHFLRRDAARIVAQWRIWLAVVLLAGPLFGLLMFTAFQFAPVSHAAVFPFSAMSVMGTVLAARYLGDRLTARKVVGTGLVIVGLVVLSGLERASLEPRALIGDAMFILAGALWAGFGILLRRFKLSALLATAMVSFFALATYVPIYLAATGGTRLLAAQPSLVLVEVLVQGVIAGAGTLYTYAKTVELLGASRAAVFPALAPGMAALLAWPVLGHVPGIFETSGLVVAMAGLLISVTQPSRSTPRLRRRPPHAAASVPEEAG